MSVPAPLRKESKLDTQVKCEELVEHTIRITSNPRVFDPKYQAFINRIVDVAIAVGMDVWEANGIRVNDASDYRERHGLQQRAIREVNTLLYLMTGARKLFHLRAGKYRAWVDKARTAKAFARNWRDSDAKRYGHLIRDAGCNAQRVDALGEPGQRQQRDACEHVGQLQQQQRHQRESRGAGSCRQASRKGCM